MKVRRVNDSVLYALVEALNATRVSLVSTEFHNDTTSVESGDVRYPTDTDLQAASATATDLPTVLTRCDELAVVYTASIADGVAHTLADDTNVLLAASLVKSIDQTTVNAALNDIKAKYTAHLTESGIHPNNDGTNTIAAADATNLATSLTLANELFTDINAHIVAALAGFGVQLGDI